MVEWTEYKPRIAPKEKVDPDYLEETRKGGVDGILLGRIAAEEASAVRDADGDGLWEVARTWLEKVTETDAPQAFPLATYFQDNPPSFGEQDKRLRSVPRALREAVKTNDFHRAKSYFNRLGSRASDPLRSVAEPLARYLSAVARHEGIDIPSSVVLQNSSGFSVDSNGRLRFDCGLYAQLGHFILQTVPGLEFEHISMGPDRGRPYSSEIVENVSPNSSISYRSVPPMDLTDDMTRFEYETPPPLELANPSDHHAILLVSDKRGRHLIVDNDVVLLFESDNPHQFIRDHYSQFSSFSWRNDYLDRSHAHEF